jgi:hypothetical protein
MISDMDENSKAGVVRVSSMIIKLFYLPIPFFIISKYMASTLFLAHVVRLKNTKLDLILGSILKQLILTLNAMCSQP